MARNIWGRRIELKRDRYGKTLYTKYDMYSEYFKMAMIFLVGYLYFHFIIMGWHL